MSAELEILERDALLALHQVLTPQLKNKLGISTRFVDGVLLSAISQAPASAIVLNRCIGLGMNHPAGNVDLASICQHYQEAGIARFFIHVHPNSRPTQLAAMLTDAGIEKARAWVKFVHRENPTTGQNCSLTIRQAEPKDMARVGQILAETFDLGEAAAAWLSLLDQAPGWRVFVSEEAGVIAGTGSVYIKDGAAWFDWGASSGDFRQRGSQSALLRHRLNIAREAGCHTIATCTGEAVAGDPQHSYNNILRAGFIESYSRDNYALPRQ